MKTTTLKSSVDIQQQMQEEIKVLEEYIDAYRELVNTRVWVKNESPTQALRLNSDDDWSFICVAMDILGDANLAISNFGTFSLDGPTRYEDVGEKYLRLYGFLSAVYIQQQAVMKLYKLMSCDSPKTLKSQFNSLKLRELRHKLASHGLDYEDPDSNIPSAYVPIRMELNGYSCSITKNRGDASETIKLDEALLEHCKMTTHVLDIILEKSIKTFFKGQQNRIEDFNEILGELREVKDGAKIIRTANGDKIVIRFE